MELTFKCSYEELKQIETFLFSQEYKEEPPFKKIKLYLTDTHIIYLYTTQNEHGKWYITT